MFWMMIWIKAIPSLIYYRSDTASSLRSTTQTLLGILVPCHLTDSKIPKVLTNGHGLVMLGGFPAIGMA
jgi:hypothetical protein